MKNEYIKSNLHTHSAFCDGKDSLEENVLVAIQKNISTLGFTSHSMYPFWSDTYMRPEDFNSYCGEIRRLKERYAEKITIRLGFEADFIPGVSLPRSENYSDFAPDYLIGSVHFIFQRAGAFALDKSFQILNDGAKKYYGGDFRPLIRDYFSLQKEMLEKGDFAIIAHADLIRKFNEKNPFFNESEEWYKSELRELAKAIAKKGVAAEVNTGAMSRGYLTRPYPCEYFLELLNEFKIPVAITADSHSARNLDYAFDLAAALTKKAGYKEVIYDIDKNGYKFCKI